MMHQNGLGKPRGANPGLSGPKVIPAATSYRGWRLKGCPKCGGDLFQEWGPGDWMCIACGWSGEVARGTLPDPLVPQLSSEEVSQ
jgi:hypothetical protein